ncbi:hypothetical protein [Flavobacterium sp. K5-23]|uniref:hypothetical protein n=1 Tax=Flavobacterium sp. K5-23 TaxID=2746225 RepID=UPI00200CBEBD|nr:hypothetical protein [Flavobacterium sp. K5-23]UQD55023.1 hypothetical protein FLAK523_00920 [Flavobacterium sp. K5-23]
MTKKNIIVALITFIVGFGSTFYIIRTFFPKKEVVKTVTINDTISTTKEENVDK